MSCYGIQFIQRCHPVAHPHLFVTHTRTHKQPIKKKNHTNEPATTAFHERASPPPSRINPLEQDGGMGRMNKDNTHMCERFHTASFPRIYTPSLAIRTTLRLRTPTPRLGPPPPRGKPPHAGSGIPPANRIPPTALQILSRLQPQQALDGAFLFLIHLRRRRGGVLKF